MGSIKSKLQSNAVGIALNVMATIAFVILALTSWRRVGFALSGVAFIGLSWRALTKGFGETITAQLLIAGGLLVEYHRALSTASAVPVVAAGALLALLIVNQPLLENVINRPAMEIANLPGYQPVRGALIEPKLLYSSTLALIAVLSVSAYASWPAWPLVGLSVLSCAAVGVVGLQALRLRLRGSQTEKQFQAALKAYDPAFALYFSAPDYTEYHVMMWLPYLERIGKPFVIILREPQPFAGIAAATAVPVVYCPSVPFVDQCVTAGMKACFYVNNGAKNSHMVRFNQLTHIQLLHGDSDKASSFNPVTAMFDKIFVAGQAGIDRYAANGVLIPNEKFDIVGRPQVETIEVSRDHIRDVTDKVVLYATTWIGLYTDANYCSLSIGEKIVQKLLDRKATVILRPHPYADRHAGSARQVARIEQILAEDRVKTGREHIFGTAATSQMSLFDCINRSDALISDVSSVASDFLYSEKPFALTNMLGEDRETYEAAFPLARAAYMMDSTAANIADVLDELLENDSLGATRREVKTYYLGDFSSEAYADGFVRRARSYV